MEEMEFAHLVPFNFAGIEFAFDCYYTLGKDAKTNCPPEDGREATGTEIDIVAVYVDERKINCDIKKFQEDFYELLCFALEKHLREAK